MLDKDSIVAEWTEKSVNSVVDKLKNMFTYDYNYCRFSEDDMFFINNKVQKNLNIKDNKIVLRNNSFKLTLTKVLFITFVLFILIKPLTL